MTTRGIEPWPSFAENSKPIEILRWVLQTFPVDRVVLTTAFGLEGCVLIDQWARLGLRLPVFYVDTGFFFPETLALRDQLAARYPLLDFRAVTPDLSPPAQASQYGEALWQRSPDLCCSLRKVAPMRRLLADAAVWVTAIRRDQSATRAITPVLALDHGFGVLKVAPLAHWSRDQVWAEVLLHDLPTNALTHQGYASIGCTHCTRPVVGLGAHEYSREGRWSGHLKTECGLHHRPSPQRIAPSQPV